MKTDRLASYGMTWIGCWLACAPMTAQDRLDLRVFDQLAVMPAAQDYLDLSVLEIQTAFPSQATAGRDDVLDVGVLTASTHGAVKFPGKAKWPADQPGGFTAADPVRETARQTRFPNWHRPGTLYWHRDGVWRTEPQPDLTYAPWFTSSPKCLNGICR